MDIKLDAINLDEIMLRVERQIEQSGKSALAKACAFIEGEAKMAAPKGRTGELARSITSKVEEEPGGIVGTVFTPLEYAPYVEYGTGLFAEGQGRLDVPWSYQDDEGDWHTTYGQHPHPYLRPALINNKEKILGIIKEGLND